MMCLSLRRSFGEASTVGLLVLFAMGCDSGTVACPEGYADCDGRCTDITSDASNCGRCGTVCDPGYRCVNRSCEQSCPTGLDPCGGTCVDPLTDRRHCGGCGLACDPGLLCDGAGECALTCQPGLVSCDGRCVDPGHDPTYCGASSDCQGENAGETCSDERFCVEGTCVPRCVDGQILCEGTCVDPATSREHCGAQGDCEGTQAGTACDAGFVCDGAGHCALDCQVGLVPCEGLCTDPQTSRSHCGASGTCQGSESGVQCASHEICEGGACRPACAAGFVVCGDRCVDPAVDLEYCGASGDCVGSNAGDFCATNERCVLGGCSSIAPVTDQAATSTQGVVQLSWVISVTPGFERSRVVRKQGSYPTGPEDGIIVAETGPGVQGAYDFGVAIFDTWFYTIFATDSVAFAPGADVGIDGTFVHGTILCPAGQVLVGRGVNYLPICSPVSAFGATLECVTEESTTTSGVYSTTATCPSGYTVTGGGFKDIDQNGNGSANDNFKSFPTSTNGWVVEFYDEAGTFTAQARCCRVEYSLTLGTIQRCPSNEAIVNVDGGTLNCGPLVPASSPLTCIDSVMTAGDCEYAISECPGGFTRTGGGFAEVDQEDGGGTGDHFESRPTDDNGWVTFFCDESGIYDNLVRCCRIDPAVANHSSSPTACPAGFFPVGLTHEESGLALRCTPAELSSQLAASVVSLEPTSNGSGIRSVACTTGVITGGGPKNIDQSGGGSGSDDFGSYYDPDTDGWTVSFYDQTSTTGFATFAVCSYVENFSLTF